MKSRKFTDTIRKALLWEAQRAVIDQFRKENRIDELRSELFDKLYEILYAPYIPHLPDDAIYQSNEIRYIDSKWNQCYVAGSKTMPMFIYRTCPKVHADSIESLYYKIHELEDKSRKLGLQIINELEKCLAKATTTKQVLTIWPEAAKVCPTYFGDDDEPENLDYDPDIIRKVNNVIYGQD